MKLQGKRILLGVTGSVAAYKAALLVRLLKQEGAEVQVIMSTSALTFITPLTLSTLSKNPVLHDFFDPKTGTWNNHVELGLWADLYLIAPLTANTLAKLANGGCDNLLTATYLSARCPVLLAPAMDLDMYRHPAVKENKEKLISYGNIWLDAESGELASGLSGQGRMMEPENILQYILDYYENQSGLQDKKILITAGPTQEAIDPVRFISNHSSGKMGIAIAEEAAAQGANVTLVLGPTALKTHHPNIRTIPVVSTEQMFNVASSRHQEVDCCIFAAAVADYAPKQVESEKIKKSDKEISLVLKKNIDIAATLGRNKKNGQIHVGFALETENEETNAQNKLKKKNFDMIVLNSMKDEGAGFQIDTNKVTFYFSNGKKETSGVLPKNQIAKLILGHIKKLGL